MSTSNDASKPGEHPPPLDGIQTSHLPANMPLLRSVIDTDLAAEAGESNAVQQTNGEGAVEQKGEEVVNGHADSTSRDELYGEGHHADSGPDIFQITVKLPHAPYEHAITVR